MKLSRTAWLIMGIGSFVVLFASLYVLYSHQLEEQQGLQQKLATSQAILPKLVGQRQSLEDGLERTRLLFDQIRVLFPKSVESIEFGEELWGLARQYGLKVRKLASSPAFDEEAGDVTFLAAPFTVTVAGEVGDIVDFTRALSTGRDFASVSIEQMDINVAEPVSDEERETLTVEEIEERETPLATFELLLYGYKSD